MSIFSKSGTPCNPGRVLIVDDEAPVRKLFRMILSDEMPDLEFDEACNGLEAVRAFKEHRHGVITMDLRMPIMDGFLAFQNIMKACEEEKFRTPVVVFCTGFVPADGVTEVVGGSSPHQLLHKPVRSAVIIEAVKNGIKAVTAAG